MKRYIDKDIIVAEINRRIEKCNIFYIVADNNNAKDAMEEIKREIQHYKSLLDFLNTLEVKEIDLNNSENRVL
jgi:ABC-type Zn uptake system ZnuABC Zn-binding protein ZnuA